MNWEESDDPTKMYLKRNFTPICQICNVPMKWTIAKPFKLNPQSHNEGQRLTNKEANARAVDCEFICPECHQWDTFGVAVEESHYDRIMDWQRKAFEEGKKIEL